MTLQNGGLVALWVGVTAYALFGGADFGGGFWDLFAGSAERGGAMRAQIAKSIGPVWEANHVWLIFALVVMWTCFPPVFAAVASTLYIPFTIAAFGIILRGSAFAFRKEVTSMEVQRIFGATFASASIITPFAFGTIAGAVASGRIPSGIAGGNVLTSWINPTSILGGLLAICVCAYTSAVFLCADCRREDAHGLAEAFRQRALATAIVIGVVGLVGIAILSADAPVLYHGLLGRGLPVIILSAVFALVSIVLLVRRSYALVRVTSAAAVVSVVWAWGVAQYPDMLPGNLTVSQAAAPDSTLVVVLVGLGVGAAMVIPSLVLLFRIAQRPQTAHKSAS